MTSNPLTKSSVYENAVLEDRPMTVTGAVNKTLLLLAVMAATAVITWTQAFNGFMDKMNMLVMTGIIAGFILALIMAFKPQNAKILSIAYAVCEGLAIGGVSAIFEMQFSGIVASAALATFLILFTMLILYRLNIITATDTFRKVVTTATAGTALFYLVELVISHVSPNFIAIWRTGTVGIILSLIFCVIASLNFILDFDFIERGAQNMVPKYFEWYGAFSLLVTIVWLYIEILRLIAIFSSRNK